MRKVEKKQKQQCSIHEQKTLVDTSTQNISKRKKTDFQKYGNEQNKTHKKPIFITFQFDEKNFIRLLNQ